jgi:nucleoid-associated protein Lsr2
MARKVQVQLTDDIDGGVADETLRYGLDGISYEIDLSAAHADKLRSSLAKFVLKSRRIGRGGVATVTRGRRGGTAPARSDREQNQAIREWAKSKDLDVNDRGRIPRSVIEQYEAEAGR